MSWFPRPSSAEDIEWLEPASGWSRADLFDAFRDESAVELKTKVGVAGRVDGSARATTRLLAVRGRVLKTRIDLGAASLENALAEVESSRRRGARTRVWHPRKQWAVYRAGDTWLPLTITPELITTRTIRDVDARMRAWRDIVGMAVDVSEATELALDLNPANFGNDVDGRLYYLDEEFYDDLRELNVAGFLVQRIPEEDGVPVDDWERWGRALIGKIRGGRLDVATLAEEVERYPLAERYDDARRALVAGLVRDRAGRDRRPRAPRIGVIADVHANLAALDAVLDDAHGERVTSYLFLGDVVGYGPNPRECISRLADLGHSVRVRGNHDHAVSTGQVEPGMNEIARTCVSWTRALLDETHLRFLSNLPLEHHGDGFLAVHGAPRDPRRMFAYVYELTYEDNLRWLRDAGFDLCFHGHSHIQMAHVEDSFGTAKLRGQAPVELKARARYLVNPGSVGQPRDGDSRAAYAIWDVATRQIEFRRVAYDVDSTVRSIHAEGLPGRLAERLRSGV